MWHATRCRNETQTMRWASARAGRRIMISPRVLLITFRYREQVEDSEEEEERERHCGILPGRLAESFSPWPRGAPPHTCAVEQRNIFTHRHSAKNDSRSFQNKMQSPLSGLFPTTPLCTQPCTPPVPNLTHATACSHGHSGVNMFTPCDHSHARLQRPPPA